MAGPGRTPKPDSRNRHALRRGEITVAPGVGWQHGAIPAPPEGLTQASVEAWNVWLTAWWASFWSPSDLPTLRVLIRLHNEVALGNFQRSAELRLLMDNVGCTPKGRQDRRWLKPPDVAAGAPPPRARGVYGHLHPVPDDAS